MGETGDGDRPAIATSFGRRSLMRPSPPGRPASTTPSSSRSAPSTPPEPDRAVPPQPDRAGGDSLGRSTSREGRNTARDRRPRLQDFSSPERTTHQGDDPTDPRCPALGAPTAFMGARQPCDEGSVRDRTGDLGAPRRTRRADPDRHPLRVVRLGFAASVMRAEHQTTRRRPRHRAFLSLETHPGSRPALRSDAAQHVFLGQSCASTTASSEARHFRAHPVIATPRLGAEPRTLAGPLSDPRPR